LHRINHKYTPVKRICILGLVLLGLHLSAQISNPLLSRKFWKTKPTIEQIKEQIASGFDISAKDKGDFDPMTRAILSDLPLETLLFILDQKGNSVKKVTHDDRSYLFWAAYKSNLPLMNILLDKGSDIHLRDSHDSNIINFLASKGILDLAVYEYLLSKGATLEPHPSRAKATANLLIAPYIEDLTLMTFFEKYGYKLTDKDQHGNSIFNYAVSGGKLHVLKQLVDKGINPTQSTEGKNAFFYAAKGLKRYSNPLAIYQYLKSLGVDVNQKTKDNSNWLHTLASKNASIDVWRFAISEGVSITQQNNKGVSPLMKLIKRGRTKLFKDLVSSIQLTDQADQRGNTLFHFATKLNQPKEIVQILKNKKLNMESKNKAGFTPLQKLVSETNNLDAIKTWIALGANKTVTTEFGESIYELAKMNDLINQYDLTFLK